MIQIERILCPTDFSPESDRALRYAIAMAKTYGSTLLAAYCPPSFPDTQERERIHGHFEATLRAHTGIGKHAIKNRELLIREGDPDDEIPQLASEQRVDLIVMNSRRRPKTAALLGSTAEAVCRTAPCPVMVIHPNEREFVGATTGEIDLKRILVAHDFSNDSELAVRYAASLAQENQAEMHMLHVIPHLTAVAMSAAAPLIEEEFQRASRLLQQAIPTETHLWCEVKHAVRQGQPYREILNYADEQEIDLICLGVHGAGFAMRALFGSNADRVLRQAPCPVLIARPLKPLVIEN
ncbi:MAG: universal stress protein [Blastocatellia bacterium]|nr:universal stress protein [Blastocatellia bacterium]